jgi:gluconolactonase
MRCAFLIVIAAVTAAAASAAVQGAQTTPDAVLDLATRDGVAAVQGTWRYADVAIVPAKHRAPDAEGQPTGAPVDTFDITPHAGGADFDDAAWPMVDPTQLAKRRGNGRLSFGWYRIAITIPARIGDFDPSGAEVVFVTALDDYAEVWVDGELPRALGQSGGSVVAGWNAPNRVTVVRRARPGQTIQLAVFGANGPLSDPPANFVWMREAKLLIFRDGPVGPEAVVPREVNVQVERLDPALDAIVPANPKVHQLAVGFTFTEGPVWDREAGVLLFSDPNENRIYRYDPRGQGALAVFRERSGYEGADIAEYRQPGSNGLAFDREGRLTIDEHGRRRVSRIEADGSVAVLAERFEGKRLNSPNDLVYRSDGTLFFTDPFFGLPKLGDDPRRELDFTGVFALANGTLHLVTKELSGPNGIALSPDERFLYVGNWDDHRKVVLRYALAADGTASDGQVFFDMTSAKGEDAIDGVKVDRNGNVYVSGPGGLWILSPEGKHLGTIRTARHVHNMAWGDEDGKSLYLCAREGLYRMRLSVAGAGTED